MNSGTPGPLPRHIYGVLGLPVRHSLSPALHTWGFARIGHAGAYFAFEKTAGELADFFCAVRALPIAGLSVTLPHKQAVMAHVDDVTPLARSVGAVNTIYWRNSRLIGDNTDVEGFLAPLAAYGFGKTPPPDSPGCSHGSSSDENAAPPALLLGAGGVCRAALAGLRPLGLTRITVAARNPRKDAALAPDFGCRVIPWEERVEALRAMGPGLVINTTPLGMHGEHEHESPLPEDAWPSAVIPGAGKPLALAYDLVYTPLETRFLAHARAQGWRTQESLTLFMAQGLAQLRLWTSTRLPFQGTHDADALRALLLSLLHAQRTAGAGTHPVARAPEVIHAATD